ncbi:MAG: hypothetical protein CMH55_00815 [Myxococcales bacterium]|nr:hypothetical protein [Myxococcales bacterium]|tara:strand:- start:201 stop:659 length:459 start_codon:yes stop_codon:yes gene_type:complete
MKTLLASLTLCLATQAAADSVAGSKSYGKPFAVKNPISLAELNKNLDQYLGKTLQLQATVGRVCKKKGCWISITDEGEGLRNVRVRFADYSYFVPGYTQVGKRITIVGKVVIKELSEAEQKHLKSDGAELGADGHPADKEINVIADGVIIGG